MDSLEQMDRLIAWLEAMTREERDKAIAANAKADAYQSAALKAKFAKMGIHPDTIPN